VQPVVTRRLAGATELDGATFAASFVALLFNLGIPQLQSRRLDGAVGASNAAIR
jgi:hypothetical protein